MAARRHGIAALVVLAAMATVAHAADDFSWVPPVAMDSNHAVGGDASRHIRVSVVYTTVPKKTAKASDFPRKYTIDLREFSIRNDGTRPVETTAGINAALQYAKKAGMNYVVFPKGTYLISEKEPILFDLKNTIVDLNGATLQVNTNGLPSYAVAKIVEGAENFRLTNGTLRGDKDTHDYTAAAGSHDGGIGLLLGGGRELEVDHLTIANFPGSGLASVSAMGRGSAPFHRVYVYDKNLEQGAFSRDGRRIDNPRKTRTIKPYDVSRHAKEGQMEFGYIAGYQGFPSVKGRQYQACFYTKDMKFIEKVDCLQYKKVQIPEGAAFADLEFNQPAVKSSAAGCGHITNLKPPREVHFHHNHVFQNRANGFSFCGGQKWIIEDNVFEESGPRAPAYGVDFEDGWLLMQDVVMRNNKFRNNHRGDLVVCSGSELVFEGNEFEKGVVFWPATLSYTFCKNKMTGGDISFGTRTGVVDLHGNVYRRCSVKLSYDGRGMNSGVYRADQPEKGIGGTVEATDPITFKDGTFADIRRITGPYLDFKDCRLDNVKLYAGRDTGLVRLSGSVLKDTSIDYAAGTSSVHVMIKDCKGELKESGAGMTRKKVLK